MRYAHGGHTNGWIVGGRMGFAGYRDHRRAQLGPRGIVSMEPRGRDFRPVDRDESDYLHNRRRRGALPHFSFAAARADQPTLTADNGWCVAGASGT